MASHLIPNNPQILLDLSTPFDDSKVEVLDNVISAMFNHTSDENTIAYANTLLEDFKNLPESWQFVTLILSGSKHLNTKYFALQILEHCIQTRWNILPPPEKEGIKQFVTQMTLELATKGNSNTERHFVNKINETLIQIVKKEWPHNWPNFIYEVCESAKENQELCENNIRLLTLLSEEIFDYGQDTMSSKKVNYMMEHLTEQFRAVFNLCMLILYNNISNPQDTNSTLVNQTLRCITHFLRWIPYGYIFEPFILKDTPTTLIDILLTHFWESLAFRVNCTKCFTEIFSLNSDESEVEEYRPKLADFIRGYTEKLKTLPHTTFQYNDPEKVMPQIRQIWEVYYCQLSICLSALLKNHRSICQAPENRPHTLFLLGLMVNITNVSDDETFKICLEYWYQFLSILMTDLQTKFSQLSINEKYHLIQFSYGDNSNEYPSNNDVLTQPLSQPELILPEIELYGAILDDLLYTLMYKMAKPQEVYIQFDQDTNEVVREYETDTDEINLYNQMRGILVLITNLRPQSTSMILFQALQTETNQTQHKSTNNNNNNSIYNKYNPTTKTTTHINTFIKQPKENITWDPTQLNRVCYTIGAISGAMTKQMEADFVVHVMKSLLNACSKKESKPDRAILASCIMYIVSQYVRFVNENWPFLQAVMKKLYDFMNETFPGVQDMACETFLKLSSKCKKVLATAYTTEKKQYLPELINNYKTHCSTLDNRQILLFFESIGYMISAVNNEQERLEYIDCLLYSSNQEWSYLCNPSTHTEAILSKDTAVSLLKILRLNTRIASSTGLSYTQQLKRLYLDFMKLYSLYSTHILEQVNMRGIHITHYVEIKALNLVKSEIITLIGTYVDKSSTEQTTVCNQYKDTEFMQEVIFPILMTFLDDYYKNLHTTRDYRVLSITCVFIKHYKHHFNESIANIFNYIFDPTLDMIKSDFRSYPDHRANFYNLLELCVEHCFDGLFNLSSDKLQNFVECLVWAFKHELPQIADQGLLLTYEFIHKLVTYRPKVLQDFCNLFYYILIREILFVLTDRLHRSGFKYQTLTLHLLLQLIELKLIYNPDLGLEKTLVMNNLVEILVNSFNNVNRRQIEAFVLDLFNFCTNSDAHKFQTHIKDFLISLKEFASNDADFYEFDRQEALRRADENMKKNQMNIPGISAQNEKLTSIRDFEDI